MNITPAVLGLLSCAVLTAPAPALAGARLRGLLPPASGDAAAPPVAQRFRRRLAGFSFLGREKAEPLRLAAAWDLMAACLRTGLPVPMAIRTVADDLPEAASASLGATANLLALGAEPAAAWAPSLACPQTAELARAAYRTARSGAALAETATAVADRIRAGSGDRAEAKAQRAAVLVTGPLGLCFLPAFLCLGVIPVVAGLAGQLTVLP